MPIEVIDNRSKLKKRQSYRSQRPDRDLNELRRLRMVRERAGQETDRLTNRDKDYLEQATNPAFEKIRDRMLAGENPSFKYGGMKKKKIKKKKVMKANKGISVNHPMDHPDVVRIAKSKKKDIEEVKKKYPILSKFIPKQSDKQIKQSAKIMADSIQTEGAKIRTATEGSFKTGGMSKARGTGCAIRGTKFKGIF